MGGRYIKHEEVYFLFLFQNQHLYVLWLFVF